MTAGVRGSGSYQCPCGDKVSRGSTTMHERGKRHRAYAEGVAQAAAGFAPLGVERRMLFERAGLPVVASVTPSRIYVPDVLAAVMLCTSVPAAVRSHAVRSVGAMAPDLRAARLTEARAAWNLNVPIETFLAMLTEGAEIPIRGSL